MCPLRPQGLKRGIVELVDMVLVNKADGDLLSPAQRAKREYMSALKLLRHKSKHWAPDVLTMSSIELDNIDLTWDTMKDFHSIMVQSGELERQRMEQARLWLWQHVADRIMEKFKSNSTVKSSLSSVEHQVRSGDLTAGQGADLLLSCLDAADQR